MRVVIAGGHGQIALRLERILAMRGDEPVGIIRNADHASELADAGATAVVLDLEAASVDDVMNELRGADAAVFAAGAGPGSGAARKDTVDRAAAELFAQAAEAVGVRRHILISAMGLDRHDKPGTDPVFSTYLKAKLASENDLRTRDLDWTIVRPGRLSNEPGKGLVQLAPSVPRGPVSRDDVAGVVAELLTQPKTARMTLELVTGDIPIPDAVASFSS